ncbi:MAG: reverse transcriptase domain-containing protein [Cetobacterium sp.]
MKHSNVSSKKPNSDKWCLVHDLRPVNQLVVGETQVVPDPHTLFSNISDGTKWYTVIDLCSAFFSFPLHPKSQSLFAFTYEGKRFTYTRLPQGYCESLSIFNQVLGGDLANLHISSCHLQYVDNLLICSQTKEQCLQDSLTVLKILANIEWT